MDYLKLTVDKLSVDAINDLVVDDSCGAISLFVGTTRDNFEGKKVLQLEYEAYEPMALKALKAICEDIRTKWPSVYNIAIYHRLGTVPCREASVVIAISSPHRKDSLEGVSYCIEQLKASVPIWKKEVYEGAAPAWKENKECPPSKKARLDTIDKNLVQINVSNDELQRRIQNFIERKREQVNVSNIQDFIPNRDATDQEDTCARVRTQFVKRNDSKGHLKIRKVENEWGPQTVPLPEVSKVPTGLPESIAERVLNLENYLHSGPVHPDIYRRLKDIENKVSYLQAVSPEYSQFWKNNNTEIKEDKCVEYTFSTDDIAKKIELLERQANM